MNLGKLDPTHYALIAFAIFSVILSVIFYYRQQQAEVRLTALVNSVRTATSLKELQDSVDVFTAYTGAGRAASASSIHGACIWDNSTSPPEYRNYMEAGDSGDDKNMCIGGPAWERVHNNNWYAGGVFDWSHIPVPW